MFDALEFRGNAQDDVEELARHAGVPVYNGLTNEWHPTQMLADFLTMHESSHRPYDELSYAFVGDCRFNMGRSLLTMGALMGSDVRLAGPAELHPPADVVNIAREIADRTGARITLTEDPAEAVAGVGFIHTDVWVSMGEDQDVWVERVKVLSPYQVNRGLLEASGNPSGEVHALPARVPRHEHGGRLRRSWPRPTCPTGSRSPATSSARPRASSSTRPRTGSTPSRPCSSRPSVDDDMSTAAPTQRTLGVRQAAFIGVGSMVGAGIFSLLGAAGDVAGAAVWLSFLIAGVVAGLQGYSFAKFGARYPSAGGLLEYVRRGYGDGHFTGIIAWLILATNAIVTSMVAISFGSYASGAWTDGDTAWIKVFAVLLILVMAALNILGSQAVARVQTRRGRRRASASCRCSRSRRWRTCTPSYLAFSGYPSAKDIVSSVALTFFAFLGFGVITFTAKDLASPARQLPRAMYLALGIATVIYVAVSLGRVRHPHGGAGDPVPGAPRSLSPPSRRSVGPVTG